MNTIKKLLAATALFAFGASTMAQNLNSAYFLDGFANGHVMNPAKDYDRKAYFSVPVLNINAGVKGNLGLQDVFFKNPVGPGVITLFHPSISYDQAMSGLNENNNFLFNTRIDLLSVGFHAFGGFNTVSLAMRADGGLNVPIEYFQLLKRLENTDYNLGELQGRASAWTELAFGHSRQINEAWRVGAKAKILLGMGYANAEITQFNLDLENPDQWRANLRAKVEMGMKNFSWGETQTKEYQNQPGTYEQVDFGKAKLNKFGLNGAGFAVDLGAEWDMEKAGVLDGMKLSASLLDLGFISWGDVATVTNNGEEFIFDGFENVQVKDGSGTAMKEQTNALSDKVTKLINVKNDGIKTKAATLGATLNLAAEYTLPAYNALRFGLLSTTRIQGSFTYNEERLSANYSPTKWLDVAANLGLGTVGTSFGWVLNVHPQGFNIFVGMDHMLGKVSKQFIPLKSNADISFGINIPLGSSLN